MWGGEICGACTVKKNSDPSPQSKASRIESPLMWGIVWARLVKLGFDGVLILDKTLILDKALDFGSSLIQRTTSNFPTARCWIVSWSDNHEGKYPYHTLCDSVYARNEKTNGL